MKQVFFIAHNLNEYLDDIKIAALYFEKVYLLRHVKPIVEATEPSKNIGTFKLKPFFIQKEFDYSISLFEKEGIIEFIDEHFKEETESEEVVINGKTLIREAIKIGDPSTPAGKIIACNYLEFFDKVDFDKKIVKPDGTTQVTFGGVTKPEVNLVSKALKFPDDQMSTLLRYYGQLFSALINHLSAGDNCLSSSLIIDKFLKKLYYSPEMSNVRREFENQKCVIPKMAFESVKLVVPNISKVSVHDILEIRQKSKDELLQFREQIEKLHFELENSPNEKYFLEHTDAIIKAKVRPAINELINRISSLKLKIPQRVLEEIKNPKSYAPLLLTLTDKISNTSALLVSLGLISLSTALEYFEKMKDIKRNGYYYLLKLRKHFG